MSNPAYHKLKTFSLVEVVNQTEASQKIVLAKSATFGGKEHFAAVAGTHGTGHFLYQSVHGQQQGI